MTLMEKMFELAAPHGKFFLILSLFAIFTTLVLSLIFTRKLATVNKEKVASQPYKIWEKYDDENGIAWYAISAATMLYRPDPNTSSLMKVGVVANNLKDFVSEDSVTKIIDEYFYGNITERSAIFVKITSAAVGDKYIRVETELGKTYVIQKPKNIPSLEVCYPTVPEKENSNS